MQLERGFSCTEGRLFVSADPGKVILEITNNWDGPSMFWMTYSADDARRIAAAITAVAEEAEAQDA
jgi:hypothetical protein